MNIKDEDCWLGGLDMIIVPVQSPTRATVYGLVRRHDSVGVLRLRSHHGAGASESRFVAGWEVVTGWQAGESIDQSGRAVVRQTASQ